MNTPAPIGILGAGSWGTALAILLARNGRRVLLWSVDKTELAPLVTDGENRQYLPGHRFPDTLDIEPQLYRLTAAASDLLVVVPSHGFRATLAQLSGCAPKSLRLAWATKGFEHDTGKLLHEVAQEIGRASCRERV